MQSSKLFRSWQVLIIILMLSYLSFSQISGGGGTNSGVIGGGSVGGSLSGQLGGILDKNIFAKVVKKNSVSPIKSNGNTSPKTVVTKSTNSVSKNKTVKKTAAKTTPIFEDSNNSAINYQPIGNTRFDQEFAGMFTQKPDEQQALLTIFSETKKAYNAEAKKMGRQNDLALVFTFFISACVTVYHDAPEPSDDATENLYQIIAQSLNESPEISRMSNEDKNLTAEKLLYVSGLIYAGYLSSKQTQDVATLNTYRQAAGTCLETLIGIPAANITFEKNGLKIKS